MNALAFASVRQAGAHSSARTVAQTATAPLSELANTPHVNLENAAHEPKPRGKNEDKPPSIKGVEWSKNRSGGWDCRSFRELLDGTITERRYIGYLGKRKLKEWCAQYKGEALRQVIAGWIGEKRTKLSDG